MFSSENTFPLGSFLYLAEKHSKDICRCSSARRQSLQTEVALFSKEHITVYRPRWKPSRSTALTHPLSSTTLQRPGPGLWSGMTSPRCVCVCTALTTSAQLPTRPIAATEPTQNQGCSRQSNSRCSRNELIYIWTKAKANGRLKTTSFEDRAEGRNGTFSLHIVDLRNDSKPSEM